MRDIRWIIKYANRKFYDKKDHKYITLADIKLLVLARENIKIYNQATLTDITSQVLFDIIIKQQTANSYTKQELFQVIQRNGTLRFE